MNCFNCMNADGCGWMRIDADLREQLGRSDIFDERSGRLYSRPELSFIKYP